MLPTCLQKQQNPGRQKAILFKDPLIHLKQNRASLVAQW